MFVEQIILPCFILVWIQLKKQTSNSKIQLLCPLNQAVRTRHTLNSSSIKNIPSWSSIFSTLYSVFPHSSYSIFHPLSQLPTRGPHMSASPSLSPSPPLSLSPRIPLCLPIPSSALPPAQPPLPCALPAAKPRMAGGARGQRRRGAAAGLLGGRPAGNAAAAGEGEGRARPRAALRGRGGAGEWRPGRGSEQASMRRRAHGVERGARPR